jgi:hypothetical protein
MSRPDARCSGRALAGWIDQTSDSGDIQMLQVTLRGAHRWAFARSPLGRFPVRLPLVSIFFILLLFVPSGPGLAQVPSGAPITDLERTELIGRMTTLLEDRYVFPDLGAQLADSLQLDERSGSFARISDPEELAGALSERIRSLSGDGHLWVMMNLDQEEPGGARTAARPRTRTDASHTGKLRLSEGGDPSG